MKTEELFYSRAYEHIIVAPHPDDELIGCCEILVNAEKVKIFLPPGTSALRREESETMLKTLTKNQKASVQKAIWVADILQVRWGHHGSTIETMVFWFPDPNYEMHPDHKIFTPAVAEKITANCAGRKVLFGLYSINMTAPYLHKLSEVMSSHKMVLADSYVSQRGYFKVHNDSFFFEGRILL